MQKSFRFSFTVISPSHYGSIKHSVRRPGIIGLFAGIKTNHQKPVYEKNNYFNAFIDLLHESYKPAIHPIAKNGFPEDQDKGNNREANNGR
jgi:hypothetical protein